jgi:hypothetical protein
LQKEINEGKGSVFLKVNNIFSLIKKESSSGVLLQSSLPSAHVICFRPSGSLTISLQMALSKY